MAQTVVNFRLDERIKKEMEETCRDMGLTMSGAFTVFATKVAREKCIPFKVSVDIPNNERVILRNANPSKSALGLWENEATIPDDFNAPLDDLKEYMY